MLQAEDVETTEILISAPMIYDGECAITQSIDGTFYHVSTVPAGFRSSMLAHFLRMAGLPEASFPAHGVATLQLKQKQLEWKLQIESPNADCRLTPK